MINIALVYINCFGDSRLSFSYTLVVLPTIGSQAPKPAGPDHDDSWVNKLERLLQQATPLTGPPAMCVLPRHKGEESDSVAKRLSRWRNNAAENCSEAFAERLAWEGLTPQTARSVLGDKRALEQGENSWTLTARRIIQHLSEACSEHYGESEIPFAPVLSPLVGLAMTELSISEGVLSLTPNIGAQLGKSLYTRLSDISHRAIGGEFRKFRAALHTRDGAWRDFEKHMRDGGLLELLERLPVLLRLLATATSLLVTETAEFLRRMEADREALSEFLGDRDPGSVEEISGGVSDLHHGGRNVKIVRFASGLQVVYKPKNLAIDAAWSNLTDWLSQRTGVTLRSPRVLKRGDWGWAEFIPHLPLEAHETAERFYRPRRPCSMPPLRHDFQRLSRGELDSFGRVPGAHRSRDGFQSRALDSGSARASKPAVPRFCSPDAHAADVGWNFWGRAMLLTSARWVPGPTSIRMSLNADGFARIATRWNSWRFEKNESSHRILHFGRKMRRLRMQGNS